jgi:hypothetical protein
VVTVVKVVAAFALGFVIGALRLPWEIACEVRRYHVNQR